VVFYLELSDSSELFVFHAHYGVYVGFGLPFGGYGASYFAGLGGGVKVGELVKAACSLLVEGFEKVVELGERVF